MNVIIAINEKYIEPVKTMLYSLSCHHRERFTVYLLYGELSIQRVNELSVWIDKMCHANLKEIYVDNTLFDNAPTQKWWPKEIYYRILAFELLPQTESRALWFDADIVVNGNIDDFYNQKFDDSYAVVCPGCNQSFKKILHLPDEYSYFNSGVILYNLEKIRKDFTVYDFFKCVELNKERLRAPDQDVLNMMFAGKVKYNDALIYNNETFGDHVLDKGKIEILHTRAKVIHFNGPVKPWNPRGANWADDLWWKYEKRRGCWKAYYKYKIMHIPTKLYYWGREWFYIAKAIVSKFIKRKL